MIFPMPWKPVCCSYASTASCVTLRGSRGLPCIFFNHFSEMFISCTGTSRKGISRPSMISRKKAALRLLNRALAKIRSINSVDDSAGDLSEDCSEIYSNTDCRLLTITKKCVEREDWRVVVCPSVPLSYFHRVACFRGDSRYRELHYWNFGQELFGQSNEF